jgi:hypothetical protein
VNLKTLVDVFNGDHESITIWSLMEPKGSTTELYMAYYTSFPVCSNMLSLLGYYSVITEIAWAFKFL